MYLFVSLQCKNSGGEIGKRSVWVTTIGSTRSNRQTSCTGSSPVLSTIVSMLAAYRKMGYLPLKDTPIQEGKSINKTCLEFET